MRNTKAKWKPAPKDQRRVASQRSAPKARFTRRQRSSSLPASLPSGGISSRKTPLLLISGILTALVALSIVLVIAVGSVIHAQGQLDDLQSAAAYYGLPTQPFSTFMPNVARQVGTTVPLGTTPLPIIENPSGDVLVVSASSSALTEPDGASGANTLLSSYCADFGTPTSIDLFDWQDWSTVSLSNAMVAQMPLNWDASDNIWRGYQFAEVFDQPADARDRWRFRFHTANGKERWIQVSQSPSTPEVVYVYAFQIITPYTNARGQHYGYHPCRAFRLPYTQLDVLLSSARAYQSSGSNFPVFAASNDPRWLYVSITPLISSFALRNIPTLRNNEPVQTVSQATSGYLMIDPDWGVWAQAKLGNTILWLDTSTVEIKELS